MILGQVADGQTNNATKVAHFLGLKDVMKPKLEAPEDHGRGQAHDGVEGKDLGVVGDIARPEPKNVALVKNVLDNKANACAYDNRGQDVVGTAVDTDDKVLGPDVC